MAGKKGDKISDAEADFFGEDLDWLDEGDPSEGGERLPVAPAPKDASPFVPKAKAGRFGPDTPDGKTRPRRPPMPTLPPTPVMLADLEADAKVDDPAPDLPTQEDALLDVDPSSEELRARRFDAPSAGVAAPPAPALEDLATAEIPREASEEAMFADGLDDQEAVPLVRTHDPAPVRVATVPPSLKRTSSRRSGSKPEFTPPVDLSGRRDAAAHSLPSVPAATMIPAADSSATAVVDVELPTAEEPTVSEALPEPPPRELLPVAPPPEPPAPLAFVTMPSEMAAAPLHSGATLDDVLPPMSSLPPTPPQLERWMPRGDEEEWRDAATALVAEAALVQGADRGRLMLEAGRIYRTRLGDRPGAEALFQDALQAGLDTPELRLELADAAGRHQRWADVAEHLTARARLLEGTATSEVLQQAAVVARQHLGKADASLERLRDAVRADADDYAGWSLLRDSLVELGLDEERIEVLGRIAEMSLGRIAGDAWWEQGRVLQRLGRAPEAQKAFGRARQADPGHVPAFLALESILRSTGDDVSLAALYEAEAERTDGPDRDWWNLQAARAYAAADQVGRAEEAFERAVATGLPSARREHQAWLARTGRTDDLGRALEAEAATLEGQTRASVLFRLGALRERVGDLEGARRAYSDALGADPESAPVVEALERLVTATGAYDALVASAEQRLARAHDESSRFDALLRLGELAEKHGDHERARAAYDQLVGLGPSGSAAGLSGLARVHRRAGDWVELAAVYERRAEAASDPAEKATLLYRATTAEPSAGDPERARELLRRALEHAPGFEPALEPYAILVEQAKDWTALTEAYEAAAEMAGSPTSRASLLCRAARVHLDHLGDPARASALVDQALTAHPQFLPGMSLRGELDSRGGANPERHRQLLEQAEVADGSARVWRLLQAAAMAAELDGIDARSDLRDALAGDPAHEGVLAAIEHEMLVAGDAAGFVEVCRRALTADLAPERRVELLVRCVLASRELDDEAGARAALEQLRELDVPGRPLRLLSRAAEALQAWELAAAFLAGPDRPEDRLHRARLVGQRLQEPRQAVQLYRELLDDEVFGLSAAVGAAGMAQRAGDLVMVVRANALVAERSEAVPLKAAYAAWTAGLLEGQDRADEASRYWRIALAARPGSQTAFEGARRTLATSGDADEIRSLFAEYRPEDRIGLAESLEEIGDDAGAAGAWRAALAGGAPVLPTLIRLERILARIDDWSGAYDALTQRREQTRDESTRASIDAKRRWLLAEKLADTDEAWTLYRSLHEDTPADREVTEALARIAGVRGDTALAVQYLRELAESAATPEESARYQRRIGEAYEAAGDPAGARQAFLDALDHVNDDAEALAGLKRLAEKAEDWQGLVAVLQRESGLVRGPRRLELRREIARVTELRIGDPAVALDAWRVVLEEAPHDMEALTHQLELSATQKEWQQFVETGIVLAALQHGAERAVLLRRVGIASEEELHRDDAARFYEQAMAESPPDLESARRMEDFCRRRGDWAGAVRCLRVRAEHSPAREDKLALLVEAASIEVERRHDRASAAVLYDRVLELAPEHEGALKFQAEYLFSGEHVDAALPVYERLEPYMGKDQDLDDFDVRMELSSFYFRFAELLRDAGRVDEALTRYERALELNPAHLPSLESVAPIYAQREVWKKAEKAYRQILQLTGGQGEKVKVAATYTALGYVERALGHSDKAQKRFSKALEVYPNHVGALKGMAVLLEDREDWSNLLNIYNNIIYHAVSADDVIHAYLTKGRVLDANMERPDKAAQHYEGALHIDAKQPVALLRMAELALRRGDWAEASKYAKQGLASVAAGPIRATLFLVEACTRQASSEAGAAAAALEQAYELDPSLKEQVDDLADLGKAQQIVRARLPK